MPTPAFVIVRDIFGWTRQTVEALEDVTDEIYLVDNDSSYRPLLRWMRRSGHEVVRLGINAGKKGPWRHGVIARYAAGRRYIVTDPDVVPHAECPADWLDHFHGVLDRHPDLAKVGFGLVCDDLPGHYAFRREVVQRQSQFWDESRRVDDPAVLYDAPVDTTLALYGADVEQWCIRPAMRTGGTYRGVHLPWYMDSANVPPDVAHFRDRADPKFGHWSKKTLPPRLRNSLGRKFN